MPTYRATTFRHETVRLDGSSFDGCTFEDCALEFAGAMPRRVVNCRLTNCRWSFVGAAADTMRFLGLMYQDFGPEAQRIVEQAFENVRTAGATAALPSDDRQA